MMSRMGNMFIMVLLLITFVAAGCNEDKKKVAFGDTPTSGSINISVDESFKPVIDQQVAMYQMLYPGTKINVQYKAEASCIKDFFNDTASRMIIITRPLLPREEKFMIDSLQYIPPSTKIASDAVALVVNINSTDTAFTLTDIKARLQGKLRRDQPIVFDGLTATSAVRFITDSILKGAAFDTTVVKAAKNSQAVLEFVAENKNAIGIVGISWIGNPEEPKQVAMLKKVKLAYVQCDACTDKPFVKPVQQSITTRRYPLVRGLYYVLKENYDGLGTGFSSFLKYEQGQLIFRRAYLKPVMDFNVRNVKVNQTLPEN